MTMNVCAHRYTCVCACTRTSAHTCRRVHMVKCSRAHFLPTATLCSSTTDDTGQVLGNISVIQGLLQPLLNPSPFWKRPGPVPGLGFQLPSVGITGMHWVSGEWCRCGQDILGALCPEGCTMAQGAQTLASFFSCCLTSSHKLIPWELLPKKVFII